MLPLDTWNNCFHLLLGNTSGHAKQHNQHSWLFDPLVPLTSPGVLVDSHSQQATGKPKKVWSGFTTKVSPGQDVICHFAGKVILVEISWPKDSKGTTRALQQFHSCSLTHSLSHYPDHWHETEVLKYNLHPNSVLWKHSLAACSSHGETEAKH